MGKSSVTPGQPSVNTNRGNEPGTGPQTAASPSQRSAHVLLSASIAPPEDPTGHVESVYGFSLDESPRPGHFISEDTPQQEQDHVHPPIPGEETS